MPVPDPMLSASARSWPEGDWIQQAKYDGYRVLIEIPADGRPRAWSRHGTSLTQRLEHLLDPFRRCPPGSVFDGELVSLRQVGGRVTQDFAAVGRAVFGGDKLASATLHYVVFDLLSHDGSDLRSTPWDLRNEQLKAVLPHDGRIRLVDSQPASEARHAAMVELGFEGSVLKRPRSIYRAGRSSNWRKVKARHALDGTLVAVRVGGDGMTYAVCDVAGERVTAPARKGVLQHPGEPVELVFSRVDADGSLREVRAVSADATGTAAARLPTARTSRRA